MIGVIRSLAPKASYGKDFWKILKEESRSRQCFADQSTIVAETASRVVQGSRCSAANRGLWTGRDFAVFRKNEACRFIYYKHSFCRGYATALDPSSRSSPMARSLAFTALVVGSGFATYSFYPRPPPQAPQSVSDIKEKEEEDDEELHTVTNWSNTHEVKTRVYIQPDSLEELEKVVQTAHQQKQKIRAVGSGLSPNGIGLCSEGMVNLALMDEILNVDQETKRVTVQAGATVEQVVEALKPYGLTLQNFASVKQQQIGGFIQVGAHGTGGKLPPVDEQVVGLKLVTGARGTLDLSSESDPELFYFARCGLGALGVVAEVTLQCVPKHRLLEHTLVTDMKGVQQNHKKWLNENKHLRYMWIPDTNTVVVVQSNPLPDGHGQDQEAPIIKETGADEKLREVRTLYKDVAAKYGLHSRSETASAHCERPSPSGKEGLWSGTGAAGGQGGSESRLLSDEQLSELSFTELRDILIAVDPGNREHILRVNRAEAEYWKLNEGYRTGWSDEILGFDCGGQQWVSEVSFPAGSLQEPSMADVQYLESLLDIIKKEGIPAPAPIEQRWTARSRSPMSLASSYSPDALFSWVGIIMYLPTEHEEERAAITKDFFAYRKAAQRHLWDRFNAQEHWAKIEVPTDDESLQWVRERLQKRFPVETFNRLRSELDPHSIFTNEHLNQLIPSRNS